MGNYAEARRVYETAIKLNDSIGARVGLYRTAILTGDMAFADQQVAAVRGRRDEVEMIAARVFAAAYRGRMNEASELASDMQGRLIAQSRGQSAGTAIMDLAIGEALVGLQDRAKKRLQQAEDDGILDDNSIDDELVVAAITQDRALARRLESRALEAQKKNAPAESAGKPSEGERIVEALVRLAEGKPAEAIPLMEPVPFEPGRGDVISVWTIAKMRTNDLPSVLKGLSFLTAPESRQGVSASYPFAFVTLARVQMRMGNKEEARKNYQKFFDLFKDADPDLPLLLEAREEFGKLGS
jgi:tetratricopeptide (TPR) repeat protein